MRMPVRDSFLCIFVKRRGAIYGDYMRDFVHRSTVREPAMCR